MIKKLRKKSSHKAQEKLETGCYCISIIGDIGIVEKTKRNNFDRFLNNLLKYVRSSSCSIISSGSYNPHIKSGSFSLLQLIEHNIEETINYSGEDDNYYRVQLIKVNSSEKLVRNYYPLIKQID